jgi:hypothetical protein
LCIPLSSINCLRRALHGSSSPTRAIRASTYTNTLQKQWRQILKVLSTPDTGA